MSVDSQVIGQQENTGTTQPKFGIANERILIKKILMGILIIATLLRLASAIYQGNIVVPLPGIYDQTSYHGLAQRVAAGYGFSFAEGHWPATPAGEPTAHWSYLYTLYLAAIYSIFGVQPLIARLIQAILAGFLHSWLAWRLGRSIFGPKTGLISAGLTAIYIYFFYYAGGLLTETFYIIGILWTLDVSFRLLDRTRQMPKAKHSVPVAWRLWLELGLAVGVTVLLRQVFLLFLPFLWIWLWWNVPDRPQSFKAKLNPSKLFQIPVVMGLIVTTMILVILIAPWTIRNYRAFGAFVPLNTNAGFAFYWGNHPIQGTHFIPLLPTDGPSYGDLIPPEFRQLNEAEMDRALLKESFKIIAADPIRFALLSLSRTVEYFKFWPSPQSGLISNISRVASFGICLPFMLYGLWISAQMLWHPDKGRQKRAKIILLYLFITVYTGIHLLTWTLIRYRLPVDAILVIFAAVALEALAQRYLPVLWTFAKTHSFWKIKPSH